MLKEAIEYIVGMKNPEIKEIGGQTYSDKELHRISYIPRASAIEMNTLSSLVDYIKANVDDLGEKMIIHIQSPTEVALYSSLDCERRREYLVNVNARIPSFPFDKFIDHETFCINVQSKFIDNTSTDRALLLKFAGTVESGTVAEYGDDGITQKATVKTGIASKGEALVPNPVNLQSYRTFIEVDQPVISFIFRMKQDKYDGISCALFEADGGAWMIDAMNSIRLYLEEQLADIKGYTIIS